MSGGDCPAGVAPVADRPARAGPGLAAGGPAEATRAERRGARDGGGLEDVPLSPPPITIGACLLPVAAAGCARREGVCRARGGFPRPGGPDRRGGPARDGVPLLLLSMTMGVCLVPAPLAVAGRARAAGVCSAREGPARGGVPSLLFPTTIGACLVPVPVLAAGRLRAGVCGARGAVPVVIEGGCAIGTASAAAALSLSRTTGLPVPAPPLSPSRTTGFESTMPPPSLGVAMTLSVLCQLVEGVAIDVASF